MSKIDFPAFEELQGRERDVALTAATYALSLSNQCDTEEDRQIVCAASLSTSLSILQFTSPNWGITKVALKSMLESVDQRGIDEFLKTYSVPPPPLYKGDR